MEIAIEVDYFEDIPPPNSSALWVLLREALLEQQGKATGRCKAANGSCERSESGDLESHEHQGGQPSTSSPIREYDAVLGEEDPKPNDSVRPGNEERFGGKLTYNPKMCTRNHREKLTFNLNEPIGVGAIPPWTRNVPLSHGLSLTARRALATALDVTLGGLVASWEDLARVLGLPAQQIQVLRQRMRYPESPTLHVLSRCEALPLARLLGILRDDLGRLDVFINLTAAHLTSDPGLIGGGRSGSRHGQLGLGERRDSAAANRMPAGRNAVADQPTAGNSIGQAVPGPRNRPVGGAAAGQLIGQPAANQNAAGAGVGQVNQVQIAAAPAPAVVANNLQDFDDSGLHSGPIPSGPMAALDPQNGDAAVGLPNNINVNHNLVNNHALLAADNYNDPAPTQHQRHQTILITYAHAPPQQQGDSADRYRKLTRQLAYNLTEYGRRYATDVIELSADDTISLPDQADLVGYLDRTFRAAKLILVLCTPTYQQLVEPQEFDVSGASGVGQIAEQHNSPSDDGRLSRAAFIVRYLHRLMTMEFHDAGAKNYRFCPVIFRDSDLPVVPLFLRNTLVYVWPRQHGDLCRRLFRN